MPGYVDINPFLYRHLLPVSLWPFLFPHDYYRGDEIAPHSKRKKLIDIDSVSLSLEMGDV